MITTKHRLIFLILSPLTLAALVGIYLAGLQVFGNLHEAVPGELYRSAQISPDNLKFDIKRFGIRSVLNLRGGNKGKLWYDAEVQESSRGSCYAHRFSYVGQKTADAGTAQQLIDIMKNAPKPLLIHCKSGADRSGLAAALYIAAIQKGGEFAAELQLSPLYGHIGLPFTMAYPMSETFEALEPMLGYMDS